MELKKQQVTAFQSMIFSWWEKNKRDLPWRHTRDPYKILVSELMLQQTQVSRVLPKYAEFLQLFPDVQSLANASVAQVLIAWKGMGYNRRALYLKKTAEIVFTDYKSQFPFSEQLISKLPGLGKYTTRALMVFAFEQNVAMIDTNIRQIIVHHFFDDIPQKESVVEEVANKLVPQGKSWEWHQALMDYGSIRLPQIKPSLPRQKDAPTGASPFTQTNRFYRGRIVDLLREGNVDEKKLVKDFEQQYKTEKHFITGIVDGLIKDGLAVRTDDILHLP